MLAVFLFIHFDMLNNMPPTPEQGEERKSFLLRATSWYKQFEKPISSVALVLGFVLDLLTIQRVDAVWENSWIIFHLLVVAVCIVLIHIKKTNQNEEGELEYARSHFWYTTVMQFSFGGLLSAFFLFYFRSSSIFVSWPFLLLLACAFWANERLKHRYSQITFQISFFFLSLFLFSIFIIPVLLHRVGTLVFIVSGLVSVVILTAFIAILEFATKEQFFRGKSKLYYSVTGIFLVMNLFYFFNIIPPIPLSLKDGGIYHSIVRNDGGEYIVTDEQRGIRDYFHLYQRIHVVSGENLVAYSAVFSPSKLNTTIVHEWERYNENKKEWETLSKVSLAVVGGRDGGYRTYSTRTMFTEGRFRVNVKNLEGQVIGRLLFEVSLNNTPPELSSKVMN